MKGWRKGGNRVTEDVRKFVDGFVGGVDEVGNCEPVRTGGGVGVKLGEAPSDIRCVDGGEDLREILGVGCVGEGEGPKLVEGVSDFFVVAHCGVWVSVVGVRLGVVPTLAPFVGILVRDGIGVAVCGIEVRFVGGVCPFVEGASFAGVEGAADPFGEGLF